MLNRRDQMAALSPSLGVELYVNDKLHSYGLKVRDGQGLPLVL